VTAIQHPLGIDLSLFPVRDRLIYLNHAGTSPMPRTAAEAMKQYADEDTALGSAEYGRWEARLATTRAHAARLINAEVDEIAFAKSTTLGLHNVAYGIDWKPGDVIIVEENTFPGNWLPWIIAERFGATRWIWPERQFRYDLGELEARLRRGGVRMVAIASANFSTGYRQDLAAIGALCRQYGALFCVDAIQTLGAFPIDVKALGIDFLSADSHKWMMGPEGAGIFYVRRDRLPLFREDVVGWLGRANFTEFHRLDLPPDPTARRFEEGAPNMGGFIAMGASIDLLVRTGPDRIAAHNRALCRVLEEGFTRLGWQVISPRDEAHASAIVCAHREGTDVARVAATLRRDHAIFGVVRRGFLRLSPHFYETTDDMRRVVEALAAIG
jgi:selenocysteine lyase/cysteine desulfurase